MTLCNYQITALLILAVTTNFEKKTRFNCQLSLKARYSIKMPFIKIFTNLSKDKFPPSLVVAFIGKMAPILGKDPSICNWSLETDRTMSKVMD